MPSQSLLIFDLDGTRFGVDATLVRESVWLPELAPAEEAPQWIVGLFILRGRIIPAVNLHLRFGRPAHPYAISDQIIVLEANGRQVGVIVNEVLEVTALSDESVQQAPQVGETGEGLFPLVSGEVRVGEDLVTVLDVAQLVNGTARRAGDVPQKQVATPALEQPESEGYFCPEATSEMRAAFRARAVKLREAVDGDDADVLSLAVVHLGSELFGIELSSVQEFCRVSRLSPIPCCPSHIVGAMNLRGDLLTLVNPRGVLELPQEAPGDKVVVARSGEVTVGVAVDDVHDVVYLRQEDLLPPPPALRERFGEKIMGTAPYAGTIMTVLNLSELLACEEWTVNETV